MTDNGTYAGRPHIVYWVPLLLFQEFLPVCQDCDWDGGEFVGWARAQALTVEHMNSASPVTAS